MYVVMCYDINTLARVVAGHAVPRDIHSTGILQHLHWLPVEQRIKFKLAMLTHNILSSSQPAYLRSLLSHHTPTRSLRFQRTLSVAFLRLTTSSRPSAPPSGSPKCLRFGHWLTLCTINIYLLTYLLTLRGSNRCVTQLQYQAICLFYSGASFIQVTLSFNLFPSNTKLQT